MADELKRDEEEREEKKPSGFVGRIFAFDAFVKKAVLIHGNKYDYSKFNYKNTKTKETIICKVHGEFLQSPNKHLGGRGCPKCARNLLPSHDNFVKEAKEKHPNDKFEYLTEYNGSSKKIKIKHLKCNKIFNQTAGNHLMGKGCPFCAGINKTTDTFISQSKNKHNDKYDYSLVEYISAKIKVKILCNNCLNIFEQTPNNHLRGKGCPVCKSSKGESKIREFLEQNNIIFEEQKRFSECRNKFPLRFDFYIPEKNILVEYDGEQHFKPVKFWKNEKGLSLIKRNDDIKNKFAEKSKIKLIRIDYTSFNKIENILSEEIR